VKRRLILSAGAATAALALFAGAAATAQTSPDRRPVRITLPLIIDEIEIGAVATMIVDDIVLFDAGTLRAIIEDPVSAELLARYDQLVGRSERISLDDLNTLGFNAAFDTRSLEIRVDLPADQMRERGISLRGAQRVDPQDGAPVAGFSAFVNLQAGVTRTESLTGGPGEDPEPVVVGSMDGAVRVGGFNGVALQWEADYDADADQPVRRGPVRLVHDDFERAIRYSLGDISYQSAEFQGAPAMGGLSIERRYDDIRPFEFIQAAGGQSFTLNRPSTVDVFVNGVRTRTLRLERGRYSLTDFSLETGSNEISLVIRDDFGEERTLQFSSFFSGALLAAGKSEFSINAGVLSGFDADGDIEYGDELAFSGFYRAGLSDRLTGQAGLQAADGVVSGLGGLTFATAIGVIDFKGAVSATDEAGSGAAASLDFSSDGDAQDPADRRFDFSVDWFSEDFASLDARNSQAERFNIAARYAQRLPLGMTGSAGLRHSDRRIGEDRASANITLNRRLGALNIGFTGETAIEGDGEDRAQITLTYNLGVGQAMRGSVDQDGAARLEYSRLRTGGVGGFGGVATLDRDADGAFDASGQLTYAGNRFESALVHRVAFAEDGTAQSQSTTGSAGVGLAYAGGRAALGRPINDSFVIVSRHPTLSGARIDVDPRREGYAARTGLLGPALAPGVTSYFDNRIEIDARNLPPGYPLDETELRVVPALFSGVLFEVGDAAAYSVIGTLVDEEGEPVALGGGEAVRADGASEQPAPFFTNRAGRFILEGVTPGEYVLRLYGRDGQARVRVDGGATLLQRVERVTFAEAGE